jgi:hypothetical protein
MLIFPLVTQAMIRVGNEILQECKINYRFMGANSAGCALAIDCVASSEMESG